MPRNASTPSTWCGARARSSWASGWSARFVLVAGNADAGLGPTVLLVMAMLFGATSSVSSGLLFTLRVVRPIVAAASKDFVSRATAPGVVARLVLMWLVTSALPSLAIALLVVFHSQGWFIPAARHWSFPSSCCRRCRWGSESGR